MQLVPVELSIYQERDGRRPFADWFQRLVDRTMQARLMQRLDRLQSGNPGDCRSLRAGLLELRVDAGPGYDIERARKWLDDAKKRSSQ